MYSIAFTSILAIILIWKAFKLFKNKRLNGDLQDLDDELVIKLNEGDTIG